MRRILPFALVAAALSLCPLQAFAQATPSPRDPATLSILVGVIHAKAVALKPNESSLVGLTGPAFYVHFDLPLSGRLALNINVGGLSTKSAASDFSGDGALKTRTIGPEFLLRVFTGPFGTPRAFIEFGPSVNFQKAELVFVPTFGPLIADEETGTKVGFVIGGGGQVPISARVSATVLADYSLIPKLGTTLDFSNIRALAGITFGF